MNAAIAGAIEGGATEVLVNDSHGAMANLAPGELVGASYLSGRHKPRYMMQGLDETFDGIFFVSYHGSMGSNGVLSHTYNPRAVYEVRLNGRAVGEAGVNLLCAVGYGVPVRLVTGDQVTIEETHRILPGTEGVVVKHAVTRSSASSLHPDAACEAIRQGARRAMARDPQPPSVTAPYELEVDWLTADMAEQACAVRGVERVAPRTVRIGDAAPLELYDRFVGTVAITRHLVEL